MVVKVGSSSLTRAGRRAWHVDRIEALVDEIATRHRAGHQVVLVSSGAIATGFPTLGLKRRPRDLATQQAAASVGQGMLVAQYSDRLRAARAHRRARCWSRPTTSSGAATTATPSARCSACSTSASCPIVNENDTVATDEIRFGDNDRLAALVAHVVQADALMLLSDVEGLFDGPPSKEGTTLITDVRGPADLHGVRVGGTGAAGVGLGGMTTKVQAASIATSAGIPVLLASAGDVGHALRTRRRRHRLPPDGGADVDPAAVAGPRHDPDGAPAPRRRSGRRRSSSVGCRCFPRASRPSTAPSSPAIRSTYWTKRVTSSPEVWSTLTHRSCRACSAAPHGNWRVSSGRHMSARSSIVTTS